MLKTFASNAARRRVCAVLCGVAILSSACGGSVDQPHAAPTLAAATVTMPAQAESDTTAASATTTVADHSYTAEPAATAPLATPAESAAPGADFALIGYQHSEAGAAGAAPAP